MPVARDYRQAMPTLAAALLALALAASTQEIVDGAPPAAWRPLDPERTLYLELPAGRVVVELAPQFAPRHVANVKVLARAGYFDGLAILRAQDNYVVQWGDPDDEDPTRARPLGQAAARLPAEFTRDAAGLPFTRLPDADGWAPEVGFSDGFPVAREGAAGLAWLAHCYGVIGAGRDVPPDSSTGASLYVVIGQSPRHLDRNITTLGRVVQGMELLSVMVRGPAPMGFYAPSSLQVRLKAARIAADLPAAERTPLELFRTEGPAWEALVESRRNRREPWYQRPAGHVDLCNVPVPVRAARAAAAPPASPGAAPARR
jgi:peptidylprolyl isomerase